MDVCESDQGAVYSILLPRARAGLAGAALEAASETAFTEFRRVLEHVR